MKFAIFGNTYQAKKSSHAENLFRLLAQRKAQLCVCREFYNFLTSDLHLNIPSAELFDGDDFCADMVISIGGDGTFLKAASLLSQKEMSEPISLTGCGIKCGSPINKSSTKPAINAKI